MERKRLKMVEEWRGSHEKGGSESKLKCTQSLKKAA